MGFSPICDPPDFFQNQALSLFYPGALTLCKKVEKNYRWFLKYLKTGRGLTDRRTRVITKDPLG